MTKTSCNPKEKRGNDVMTKGCNHIQGTQRPLNGKPENRGMSHERLYLIDRRKKEKDCVKQKYRKNRVYRTENKQNGYEYNLKQI